MPKLNLNNVLVVEIGGSHIECVHSMVHLLHLKHNRVFLSCNEKLIDSAIEKNKLSDILPLPNKISGIQKFRVFLNVRRYIKRHAIGTVVFNTTEIALVRDLLLFLPKMNYVGVVHNAAKIEKSSTLSKLMSWRIKKILLLSNYLLKQIKPFSIFKVSVFFPIYFPQPALMEITKPEGEFWIVVPGGASNSRRDYEGLITTLREHGTLPSSLRFVFLGKYYLEDIVTEELRNSDWWKRHFIVFNQFVDYDTFHAYLKKTDVLLPLLKKEDDFYGQIRISGAFNLGLGYKLPFLLPESYRPNTDLQPYSMYYKDMQELIEILLHYNSVHRDKLNEITLQYKNGPFNNFGRMADEVCDFIFSK
jgi:hypothetical protein